jgi:5'-nucleotidase
VDLEVGLDHEVSLVKLHAPRFLCQDSKNTGPSCITDDYEGSAVTPDESIEGLAKTAADFAESVRSKEIGITLAEPVLRSRSDASTLGNLFAELMLAAQPEADLAITNGGSLRADLPAGPLRYGDLFEAMPFDNRFAMVRLRGKTLRKLFTSNLQNDSGILSVAGLQVQARCKGAALEVTMKSAKGKTIGDKDLLMLATSDFIASGGDGLLGAEGMEVEKVEIDGGLLIRDAMAKVLKEKSALYTKTIARLHDPKKPRIRFTGSRPLRCQ